MSYIIYIKDINSSPKWANNFVDSIVRDSNMVRTRENEYMILNHYANRYNVTIEDLPGADENWIFENEEDATAFILSWS